MIPDSTVRRIFAFVLRLFTLQLSHKSMATPPLLPSHRQTVHPSMSIDQYRPNVKMLVKAMWSKQVMDTLLHCDFIYG